MLCYSEYLFNIMLCFSAISPFLAKKTRSLAIARIEMFSIPIWTPSVISSKIPITGSKIRLKMIGENGSFYLTDLNMFTKTVFLFYSV